MTLKGRGYLCLLRTLHFMSKPLEISQLTIDTLNYYKWDRLYRI